MAKFTTQIPHDHISVYQRGMTFGKSIAKHFENVQNVTLILNFEEKTLIIMDSGELGYPIYRPDTHRIYTPPIKEYIWKNYYKAQRLNSKSIIIRDITFKKNILIQDSKRLVTKMAIIVMGNLEVGQQIISDYELSHPKEANLTTTPSSTVSPVQEPPKKTIVDKEYPLNEIPGLSGPPMPTSEAQDRADKAYSRLILGE